MSISNQLNRLYHLMVLALLLTAITLPGCSDDPVSTNSTGFIKGVVKDDSTNAVLASVTLTTAPSTSSVVSDTNGMYLISKLTPGTYAIAATKDGYTIKSVNVSVLAGETTFADLALAQETGNVPALPTDLMPENMATNQPVNSLTLSWAPMDPESIEILTYDVSLFSSDMPAFFVGTDLKDAEVEVTDLAFGTTYFWQVTVKNEKDERREGPVLQFTTQQVPNNPVIFAARRGNNFDIYSAGTDSLDDRLARLTRDPGADKWPRMSPDRSRIAFSSDRTGDHQIFIMDRDGENEMQVTTVPVAGFNNNGIGFTWSPDGSQLLYANYEKLYRIDATGGNLTQIATAPADRHFREIDWSPLGDKIVVLTIGSSRYDAEIYTMDTDGSNLTLVVDNDPGALASPSFSIDGQTILYTYDISGFESNNGRQLDTHIFTVALDGTNVTDLSAGKPAGTNDTNPRWSPTGASIVFENARNDGSVPTSLWLMSASGTGGAQVVTEGAMPDWR